MKTIITPKGAFLMKLRKFLAVLTAIVLLAACVPLGAISVSAGIWRLNLLY